MGAAGAGKNAVALLYDPNLSPNSTSVFYTQDAFSTVSNGNVIPGQVNQVVFRPNSSSTFFACGEGSDRNTKLVWRSVNGGASWDSILSSKWFQSAYGYGAMGFSPDGTRGVVFSSRLGTDPTGFYGMYTWNGGQTWAQISCSRQVADQIVHEVTFLDDKNAFAVFTGGGVNQTPNILRSIDSGKSWFVSNSLTTGDFSSPGSITSSGDGGCWVMSGDGYIYKLGGASGTFLDTLSLRVTSVLSDSILISTLIKDTVINLQLTNAGRGEAGDSIWLDDDLGRESSLAGVTNANGFLNYAYSIPVCAVDSTYTIIFTAIETGKKAASQTIFVRLTRGAYRFSVTPASLTLSPCEISGTFRLTLLDSCGKPVVGQVIGVEDSLISQLKQTTPTDSLGESSYTVTLGSQSVGVYSITFRAIVPGYQEKDFTAHVQVANNTRSCYNIYVTADHPDATYEPTATIGFTLQVETKDGKGVPGVAVDVFDPSPQFNFCPNIITDSSGVAPYTSPASGMEGWGAYGFRFYFQGFSIDTESVSIQVKNNPEMDTSAMTSFPNHNLMPKVPQPGDWFQPFTLQDVIDVGEQAMIQTATDPAVFLPTALCGIGLIGTTVGVGAPVAAIACPDAVATAEESLIQNTAIAAADKVIDHANNLNANQKGLIKNGISLVSLTKDAWASTKGLGHLGVVEGDLKVPQGGESVLSYHVSTNQGNFAKKYADMALTEEANILSTAKDVADENFGPTNGTVVPLPNSPSNDSVIVLTTTWKTTGTSAVNSYKYACLSFQYNPSVPGIPSPLLPLDQSIGVGIAPSFLWLPSARAFNYQFQLSDDSSGFPSLAYQYGKDRIQSVKLLINDSTITDTSLDVATLTILANNQIYYWRVRAIGDTGLIGNWSPIFQFNTGSQSDVEGATYSGLYFKSYPNPATSSVFFEYNVNHNAEVTITLYDVMGRIIASPLPSSLQTTGNHQVEFDSKDLPTGLYYCRLSGAGVSESEKLVISR